MIYPAEIISVGSEILEGKILNTNTQFLGSCLSQLGFSVRFQSSCGDNVPSIMEALDAAIRRAALVVVTGGLGPTPDDVTREAIVKFFDTELVFHRGQYRRIVSRYRKMHRKQSLLTKRESMYPKTAHPLINRFGMAIGFAIEQQDKLVVVLPGVPSEVEGMFGEAVKPLLIKKFHPANNLYPLTVNLMDIDEPAVIDRLGSAFFEKKIFNFGIYPCNGIVTIRIKSKSRKLLKILGRRIKTQLKEFIFSWGDQTIEETVASLLYQKRLTLATAESCTGGLLAKRLTDVPGASHYFIGSVISYADKVKNTFLNVPVSILKRHGAVSKETARLMAVESRKRFSSDISLSITGIAGPGGGNQKKPVGLVWMALSDSRMTYVKKCDLFGSRSDIRYRATQKALFMLYRYLTGLPLNATPYVSCH